MKKVLWPAAILLCLPLVVARAESPYDTLAGFYQPFMRANDPLTWPFKIRSITLGQYNYWRGTKPQFYAWAKTDAADWFADKDSYTLCHGDLHIGNTGTYAVDAQGKLAFGMVDFDESCRLPFELELLGASISLELWKLQAELPRRAADSVKDLHLLLEAYRAALGSDKNAAELLANDSVIKMMLKADEKEKAYKKEVKKLAPDGKFVSATFDKDGRCKDILRSVLERKENFAQGIAEMLARSPKTRAQFNLANVEEVRKSIRDIALRTRIDSSGSQGFDKYFVLMNQPLKSIPGDAVLYLKREVACAAELAGAIPHDDRPGGQRASEAMAKLTSPAPFLNDWCQIGGESYWVTLREPWSDDTEPGSESNANLAQVLGTVAGSVHRLNTDPAKILARLTPELEMQLRERTDAYVAIVEAEFAQLNSDPRVHDLLLQTQQTLSGLPKN